MQPTEPVNTPPPDEDPNPAADIDRAQALQDARTDALSRAMRLTIGDERFDPCDMIDVAEYIRTGARGVTLPPEAPTFLHLNTAAPFRSTP